MFYTFLIALVVIYIIYYFVVIILDIQRIAKSERVDDVGDDVDISSAVGNYVPIDSSEIISENKDNENIGEVQQEQPKVDESDALADTTDYSDEIPDNIGEDENSSEEFFNQHFNIGSSFNSEDNEGATEEDDSIEGGGLDNSIHLGDDGDKRADDEVEDLGDEPVAVHGGYLPINLDQMFRDEYEKTGDMFIGMKVTSKS